MRASCLYLQLGHMTNVNFLLITGIGSAALVGLGVAVVRPWAHR
jgi:hypothetical protein